jgi:glyoxylase-like metal-dependent hydrolase (beta-lactamase superfamily II)
VHRIQLDNTVFEGENAVYLIDAGQTALVDTAVATPPVRADLEAGLEHHGVGFADIDTVVLTHWHPDHAGLAGAIQAESDARVVVHAADAPIVDGSEQPLTADPAQQRETFTAWGMPAAARERLQSFFESVATGLVERDPTVTPVEGGDVVDLGGVTLETVHLPGHTAGLCGFAFDPVAVRAVDPTCEYRPSDDYTRDEPAHSAIFTGDALLPRYTPNVGGADVRVEDPLATYVASLARLVDRDPAVAHPGHRDRIDEPGRRAAEILAHHRERTSRVIDVLDRGPATAWDVSAALFGDLEGIHVLHGPGEAFAHLDHLAAAGVAERDGATYRLVESTPDVDTLFPTTRLDDAVSVGHQ